jgi:hypothetical protein
VTDYRLTLNSWDNQIGLKTFGNLIAHIKITPGQEEVANSMRDDLKSRGFTVLETLGGWSRGLSHGAAYLSDMVTVSKYFDLYSQPYFLLLEDDSPVLAHRKSLFDVLTQAYLTLEANHELLTVRTIRRGDYDGGVQHVIGGENDIAFYSPNTDFQPMLLRSSDYYRLCIALERNPEACQKVHCEMLWRLILDNFSRSEHKHLVFKPDYCEALHIGIPEKEHKEICLKYNLL